MAKTKTPRGRVTAPGLKWRKRKRRPDIPCWFPSSEAVSRGYPSGYVNLEAFADSPAELVARCQALTGQMQLWLAGHRKNRLVFDGTIGSVLRIYESHEQSPFRTKIKPSTRAVYTTYLARLEAHIGKRRVADVIGLEVQDWFRTWSSEGEHVAAGKMAAAVLKAAMVFGCASGIKECRELRTVLEQDVSLPSLKSRKLVMTAADVTAARKAAHARGAPLRALAYALQFETVLRQWDVRGQWVPVDSSGVGIVFGAEKWFGLCWHHIRDEGGLPILRYKPGKTDGTTGVEIIADLSVCPMVMEELALLGDRPRSGPVILNERTGLPYKGQQFRTGWRGDFKRAGIPHKIWNRDMRASAITEARGGANPASIDDAAKVAGHTEKRTTAEVYDRERLEAQRRFQAARISRRGE